MSNVLASALSGFVIPISFYPAWAAAVLTDLPWASFVQAPIDVFLERPHAWFWLVRQAVWAAVLLAAGRRRVRRGGAAPGGAGRMMDAPAKVSACTAV